MPTPPHQDPLSHLTPAFRERATGAITLSPGFHDVSLLSEYKDLPAEVLERTLERISFKDIYEEGFVDATGKFYTRKEVLDATGIRGESQSLKAAKILDKDGDE